MDTARMGPRPWEVARWRLSQPSAVTTVPAETPVSQVSCSSKWLRVFWS